MAANRTSVGEAQFSLILQGDNLSMDAITERLGLSPTLMIRKGDLLNKLPRMEAATDEWVCTIALTDPEGEDAELNSLLQKLIDRREALSALMSDTCQATLRLYVQSDRAQILYRLTPETLQNLASVHLPIDVTSLSWGEIGL